MVKKSVAVAEPAVAVKTAKTAMQELLGTAIEQIGEVILERDELIKLMFTALIARQNIFIGGAPGEAKTMLAEAIASVLDMSQRYHLFSNDTMPDEFIGSIDLVALNDGVQRRNLAGGLTQVEIFIADELFKSCSAALNPQLGILNEKRYQNGSETVDCPLELYVGLSNELPPKSAAAFWDRLSLRYWTERISESAEFELMMRSAGLVSTPTPTVKISREQLEMMRSEASSLPMDEGLLYKIQQFVQAARKEGIEISTRKVMQSVKLVQVWAYVNGASAVRTRDCHVLRHILWSDLKQKNVIEQIVSIPNKDEELLHSVRIVEHEFHSASTQRHYISIFSNGHELLENTIALADEYSPEVYDECVLRLKNLLLAVQKKIEV